MKKLLVLLVCAVVCCGVFADRLTLIDGSVIMGKVDQKLGGTVTFTNAVLGTVKINEGQIAAMEIDASMNVADAEKQVVTGKVTSVGNGKMEVEGRILALPEIFAMWNVGDRDLTQPPPRKWEGEFYANMIAKSGNTRKFNGGVGAKAVLVGPDDRFSAGIYAERERNNHQTTTKKYYGNTDYERNITDMTNWYVNLEGEKNEIDDIDFRWLGAAGFGHYLVKEADFKIRIRAGFGYQQRKFKSTDDSESSMIAEFGFHLEKKFEGYGSWVTDVNYVPALDDIHDYRVVHETSFDMPLAFKTPLSLRLGIKHEYDSKTSDDVKRLDTTYFANIVYRW